jgi:hypothetical protein
MLLVAVLLACTPAGSGVASSPRTAAVPATPPPCVQFQAVPGGSGTVGSAQQLWTLADGLQAPDDLLFDSDGTTLVGEYSAGRLARVGGPNGIERLPQSIPEPEGIARIGDTLYVADQVHDRVMAVDASGNVRTFLQLSPVAGVEGLDGIASMGDTLIVPDSPRGTVLFVDQAGAVTRRASGFARPTGAWPLADGSVLIADENANSVFQLLPDGSRKKLDSLAVADDVVQAVDGRMFAISESNGQLIELGKGPLATRLGAAQGLGTDGAGNLLVTESGAGRLDLILLAYKLQPQARALAVGRALDLCLQITRAAGFSDPVQIDPGEGYQVVTQISSGIAGEVRPAPCQSPPCRIRVVTSSGKRTDAVWITYTIS